VSGMVLSPHTSTPQETRKMTDALVGYRVPSFLASSGAETGHQAEFIIALSEARVRNRGVPGHRVGVILWNGSKMARPRERVLKA
jgi:hypothetical protein